MHIDEQTENVGAEQAVFFPAGSVQYISTMGEEDLEFLANRRLDAGCNI